MASPTASRLTLHPASVLRSLAAILAVLVLSACAPRQLVIKQLADELAAQGQSAEADLELARDAAPYHLKLS